MTVHGKPENGWYRSPRPARRVCAHRRPGDGPGNPAGDGHPAKHAMSRMSSHWSNSARQRPGTPKSRNQDDPGRGSGEIITATDLNLRQSPSQDAPVTAVMPRGELLVPTGEQRDGFVEVRWQNATGWALGRHLATRRRATAKPDRHATSWRRHQLIAIIYELPITTDNHARTCCAWLAVSPISCRRRSTRGAGRMGCSSSSRVPGWAPRSRRTTSSTLEPAPTPLPGCGHKAGAGSGYVSRRR